MKHWRTFQWRHNGCDGVSNHQPHHCLLNRLFRRRSKKTSKLHVTGLCAGNSPETGEFPAQMASKVENVFIWWCHHGNIVITVSADGLMSLTLKVRGPSLTRSISWLLMPWLLASPGHQQPWYWLCRIGRSLSYSRRNFSHLCHIGMEEWHKM